MTRPLSLLLLLLIIFPFIFTTNLFCTSSFLKQLNGPYGGFIRSIIFRDNIVYAAGIGGLFQKPEGAEKWSYLGMGDLWAKDMAQDELYIYVAGYYGCYRYNVESGGIEKIYTGTVQTVVTMDSILLIGLEDYPGILKSTDHGNTFFQSNQGINNYDIEKLFVTSSGTILAAASGTSGSGVFRSTDKGETWKRIDPNPYAWTFVGISEYNGVLYAFPFQNHSKVYVSYDDGLTWQLPSGATAPSDHIHAIFVDESGLYVSSVKYGSNLHGIFWSNDMGRSWVQISDGLRNKDVFCINEKNGIMYVGGYGGVHTKSINSDKWEPQTVGLTNSIIYSIVQYKDKLFAATHGVGLQMSEDGGLTWSRVDIGVDYPYIFDLYAIDGHIFIIASFDYLYPWYGEIFRSDNGGATWVSRNAGLETGLLKCIQGNKNFLLVGSEYGLYRSLDLGTTWEQVKNGIPYNINVSDIAVWDSVAIVVNGTGSIFRSEDYGYHWNSHRIGSLFQFKTVAAIDGKFYLGNGWGNKVLVSSDLGITWNELDMPIYNADVEDFAGDGEKLFIALSRGGGVIASYDSGKTWQATSEGLTTNNVISLLYSKKRLLAGTYGGGLFGLVDAKQPIQWKIPVDHATIENNYQTFIWYKNFGVDAYRFQLSTDSLFENPIIDVTLNDTIYTVKNLDFNQTYYYRLSTVTPYWNDFFSPIRSFRVLPPKKYILDQNAPNPFNSTTLIKYHVPKEGQVEIILYNALGRKIKTFTKNVSTPGSYTLTITASGLSSGVYFYVLKSKDQKIVRKMLLIK